MTNRPRESLAEQQSKRLHLAIDRYSSTGMFSRFVDLVREKLSTPTSAEGLRKAIASTYNKDDDILSIGGINDQQIEALKNPSLKSEDRSRVDRHKELVRKSIGLELPTFFDQVLPDQWKEAFVGYERDLYPDHSEEQGQEVFLDKEECAARCMAVQNTVRDILTSHGIEFRTRAGLKHHHAQVDMNGGLSVSFAFQQIGIISMQTPWGEIDIVSDARGINDAAIREIKRALGLNEPTEGKNPPFTETYYSVTRIEGVDGPIPEIRLLERSETRDSELVQREWRALTGENGTTEIDPELKKLVDEFSDAIENERSEELDGILSRAYDHFGDRGIKDLLIAGIGIFIRQGRLEEAGKFVDIVATECGAEGIRDLLPFLNTSSLEIQESIVEAIDSNIFDIVVKDAIWDHIDSLTDILEKEITSGRYADNTVTGTGYKVVNIFRNIGSKLKGEQAKKAIELLVRAIDIHDNPQYECDALGEFGTAAEVALPILERVSAQNPGHDGAGIYARDSIAKIRKDMSLSA